MLDLVRDVDRQPRAAQMVDEADMVFDQAAVTLHCPRRGTGRFGLRISWSGADLRRLPAGDEGDEYDQAHAIAPMWYPHPTLLHLKVDHDWRAHMPVSQRRNWRSERSSGQTNAWS